ncbi:MAG TPA: hypothetical protein PLY93_15540, partial [Turneriella sp.]|nr:hypothetical protein [Turneriella sp.]
MRLVDNFFTPTHTNTNSLGRNRNTIVDVKLFTTRFNFPAIKDLGANEILGFGADLEPDTLLYAYTHGFFPWYNEPPITWQAPLVRMVLRKNEIHVSRSLKKFLRRSTHTVRKDTAFREVIH